MRFRDGVSPMIVLVLIIAVTLVVGLLSVTWIMGLWNTTGEEFVLQPVVEVSFGSLSSRPVLQLYVVNKGQKGEIILKVDVKSGNGFYENATEIPIPAGFHGYINITSWTLVGNPLPLTPGDVVRVYIYTDGHGMLFEDLVVTGVS